MGYSGVPDAGGTFVFGRTRCAFQLGMRSRSSREAAPTFSCFPVRHIVPRNHELSMTPHVNIMQVNMSIVEEFDGALINPSKSVLFFVAFI